MTIAYFSNFLNHHQKLVADILAATEGIEYTFVETVPMYEWLKKGGYSDFSQVSYVLRAWESQDAYAKAIELAKSVDVALFGGPEVLKFEVLRARSTGKLSFEVSERWLKRGVVNVLSPRLLKYLWYYHTLFKKKAIYKLCSSAFGATDQYRLNTYIDKCYKWGYFTAVDSNFNVKENFEKHISDVINLMWCSRFLTWKHPELPIMLASILKEKHYRFHLNMFGTGEKLEAAKHLVSQLKLESVVSFKGNIPNQELLQEMRNHQIFLFTSDQNEGWGAVANESMANGCVIVGADAIGSIPFLVKDKVTGLIFQSANKNTGFKSSLIIDNVALQSLALNVEWLLNNPEQMKSIAIEAYKNMCNIWSPDTAAQNLLTLINCLLNNQETSISEGPCSKAIPM